MSSKLAAELKALEKMADSEIALDDIPEVVNWSNAVVGKYYRPVKKQVSIRLDMDIIAFFMGLDKAGYQVRINDALRQFVAAQSSKPASPRRPAAAKATTRRASSTPKKKAVAKSAKSNSKRAG